MKFSVKLLGRWSKTVDFRKVKGGVHSADMEAPHVAADKMWSDESFTPEMAMKGMTEHEKQSNWPIWKRTKVVCTLHGFSQTLYGQNPDVLGNQTFYLQSGRVR